MGGDTIFRDQRAINAVARGRVRVLPPEWNLLPEMTLYRGWQIRALTGRREWYSDAEIMRARREPLIVHFAGGPENRPWDAACAHPWKPAWDEAAGKVADLVEVPGTRGRPTDGLRKRAPFLAYAAANRLRHNW